MRRSASPLPRRRAEREQLLRPLVRAAASSRLTPRRAEDARRGCRPSGGRACRRARSRAPSSPRRGGCSGTSARSRAAVTACGGLPVTSVAVEDDRARGRLVDAGEHVEERRLAGAVRADQADDRRRAGTVKSTSLTATRPPNSLRTPVACRSASAITPPPLRARRRSRRRRAARRGRRARTRACVAPRGSARAGRNSITTSSIDAVDAELVLRHVEV